MLLRPGVCLGDRYVLERQLARGGMGEVWQGRDTLLDRPVAVKVARPELAADTAFGQRLLEEARHASAVVHPGIAAVYDVDAAADVPYLVLELVEGRPLSRVLAEEGPLPAERTRHLVCQVAHVLAAAHAAGLVHRDVKPSNLLVTDDDVVKVTDFGISRAVDSATVTRTGFVVGTAQYLSPEQACGRPASPASDLYALGVVAYECLAGRRPFDGDPLQVLRAHREDPVPDLLAGQPADLRQLVSELLDKDPARRPTAEQVVGGPPAAPVEQAMSAGRRKPALAGALAGAVGALGGRRRTALAAAGAVVAAAVLGVVPGLGGADDGPAASAASGDAGSGAVPVAPLPVAAVTLFHPGGSGSDNADEVGLAVDGDPATAWTTQRYASPQFGNLRPGVGLLLDLGAPREVREVRVAVGSPGLDLRLHAAAAPDPALLDGTPLGVARAAPASVAMSPDEPVTAQFFVLWIDRLPDGDGRRHRAAISEISLLG